MSDKYVVVSGNYDNKTGRLDFIQALGTYYDCRQAYGVALLQLCDFQQSKEEKVTPLFPLEGDTGYGISIRHEAYTDFCYILFCDSDDGYEKKEESDE